MKPRQPSKIIMLKKPPRTKTNLEVREREYLTENEINKILNATRKNSRNPLRDEALIYFMFRHGLRVSEACCLKWSQVDFVDSLLHVKRLKGGVNSVHPIGGTGLRLLRRLERKSDGNSNVFLSERKLPIHKVSVHRIVKNMGAKAGLPFPIHPHMLRHSCGYYLANKKTDLRVIQLYLGHKNIQHTTIYTQLNKNAFFNLWDD